MTEQRASRGEGNVASALRTRRRREREMGAASPSGPTVKRRKRPKVGKRSDPDYKLAPAYVRVAVHDRVMQALKDSTVRQDLLEFLEEWEVQHVRGKVTYSDLSEALLLEWLSKVGWEVA